MSSGSSISVDDADGEPVLDLNHGALVCFRNDGRLLMVVQHDRHWMLEAVSGAPLGILHNPDEGHRGLPSECLFTVCRAGETIAFRSVGADGRMLQATRGTDSAHQVTNYNFGSWESWVLEEGTLYNVQFPEKRLRLEVIGVACAAHRALWDEEQARVHATHTLHAALQAAQYAAAEAERRLRDEVTAVRAEAEAAAQDAGRRLRASDDERLRLTTALTAQTALAEDLQLQWREQARAFAAQERMRAAELERERALRIKAEAECAEADAELQVERERLDSTLQFIASAEEAAHSHHNTAAQAVAAVPHRVPPAHLAVVEALSPRTDAAQSAHGVHASRSSSFSGSSSPATPTHRVPPSAGDEGIDPSPSKRVSFATRHDHPRRDHLRDTTARYAQHEERVDTQGADNARDGRDASTLVRGGLGSGPTQYGGRGATIVDASPAPDSSPHSPLPDVMVSPDDAAAAVSSSPRNAARAPSVRRSWQLGSGPTDAAGTTHSSDTSPLPSVSPDAPGRSLPAHAPRGTGSPLTRQERSSSGTHEHEENAYEYAQGRKTSHARHAIAEGGIGRCPPFELANKENQHNRISPSARATAAAATAKCAVVERESLKSVSALRESVASLRESRSASSSPLLATNLDLCVSCWETCFVCKCEAKAEREESRRILETREPAEGAAPRC